MTFRIHDIADRISQNVERQEAYDEAQRILLETDVAIMPLFVGTQNWVVKPYVRGFKLNALELLYLKEIYLERS